MKMEQKQSKKNKYKYSIYERQQPFPINDTSIISTMTYTQ